MDASPVSKLQQWLERWVDYGLPQRRVVGEGSPPWKKNGASSSSSALAIGNRSSSTWENQGTVLRRWWSWSSCDDWRTSSRFEGKTWRGYTFIRVSQPDLGTRQSRPMEMNTLMMTMIARSSSTLKRRALSCSSSRFLEVSNPQKGEVRVMWLDSANQEVYHLEFVQFVERPLCRVNLAYPCIPEGPFMDQK